MTITAEQLQSMRCDATDGLNTGGQGTVLLAKHVLTIAAEVERLQALLAPTRGSLGVAYNSACARRVDAWQRAVTTPSHHPGHADAMRAFLDAQAEEAAKRAALDAFEQAHGLDMTHPDAGEPCPGSRGW